MLIVHLFVSYAHGNLCHFFSSSWCQGFAATSACGSSWTFLFTFFIMGKWCLHARSFIFDQIIIKNAGNQDRHKISVEFDFGPNQTTHFGVTCP